jgi:hypothetical protein
MPISSLCSIISIYDYQRTCASAQKTWHECGQSDPYFDTWRADTMQLDAVTGNVADLQSQRLSYHFETYCTYIVEATSAAKATQFLDGVVDSATALDIRLGDLLQQ